MANRIDGQIWIGRDSPNVLKYHVAGTEYWTTSASTYRVSGSVKKGNLLAVASTGDKVSKFLWPRDTRAVVGIALNDAENGEQIRAVSYGYVEFTASEIEQVFVTGSDYNVGASLTGSNYYSNFGAKADGGAGNGWNDTSPSLNGVGAPVYCFIGRHLKTSSSYSWVDPSSYPGKLTFATPVGYQPTGKEIPWNDSKFNVSFKDLPRIGTVVDYEYTNSILTKLVIHVNFSQFNREVQFEYPAEGVAPYQGNDVHTTLDISTLPGLFPNLSDGNAGIFPHVHVKGWGFHEVTSSGGKYYFDSTKDNNSFSVQPGYDSYYTGNERGVTFQIISDSAFYYKVAATIHYGY